jgi:inner membrane protein
MMAKTHLALGVTVASLALSTADPLTLGIAAAATQLPDVDTSRSLAGRIVLPLSRFLEHRFPHRTITHSFLATGVIAVLSLPLRWMSPGAMFWHALVIGYFFGWFGDVFTKQGVAAFWPGTMARLVIPGNPRLRLSTGTKAEYCVLVLILCGFGFSLHLHSVGGLMRSFSSLLGQPEGVVALWQKESLRYRIIAHIEGRNVVSAAPVSADFEVIEGEGEKLLVRDAHGLLYLAGAAQSCPDCQIAIDRVEAKPGPAIITEVQELRFTDRDLAEVLQSLRLGAEQPLTTISFSGELLLRDAQLLIWPASLQRFNAVQISEASEGSRVRTVKLRAASLAEMQRLSEYFGSGHLLVKAISEMESHPRSDTKQHEEEQK